jgi:hypothetical protein
MTRPVFSGSDDPSRPMELAFKFDRVNWRRDRYRIA